MAIRKVYHEATHVSAKKDRKPKFNPDSETIAQLTKEYLDAGGQIHKIEEVVETEDSSYLINEADDFLLEN